MRLLCLMLYVSSQRAISAATTPSAELRCGSFSSRGTMNRCGYHSWPLASGAQMSISSPIETLSDSFSIFPALLPRPWKRRSARLGSFVLPRRSTSVLACGPVFVRLIFSVIAIARKRDGDEHLFYGGSLWLILRRKNEFFSQQVALFVDRKARAVGRYLKQYSSGSHEVDRMKIISVYYVCWIHPDRSHSSL